VNLNGVECSVTVGASTVLANGVPIALPGTAPGNAANTLAKIGSALVQAINATAPDSFTAYLDGTTLVIANRSGAAFDASATVALQTPTSGSIVTAATGSAIVASLSGDPLAGENRRLTLDGNRIYEVVVGGNIATRNDIAAALAQLINPHAAGTATGSAGLATLTLDARRGRAGPGRSPPTARPPFPCSMARSSTRSR
jgi:hypothetical protein